MKNMGAAINPLIRILFVYIYIALYIIYIYTCVYYKKIYKCIIYIYIYMHYTPQYIGKIRLPMMGGMTISH